MTKYRTGSHRLKIYAKRKNNENRDDKRCTCNKSHQTSEHVLFHCELTNDIRQFMNGIDNMHDFFANENYTLLSTVLRSMEKILKIKSYEF